MDAHWRESTSPHPNCNLDLTILQSIFGFAAPTGGGVPEPASLALLALGGLAMLRPKRS